VKYFFPVNVLAALTATPGSGIFPDFTTPLISPYGAAVLAGEAIVGDTETVVGASGFDCDDVWEAGADWLAGEAACPQTEDMSPKTTTNNI
jgi:hypothetical protein